MRGKGLCGYGACLRDRELTLCRRCGRSFCGRHRRFHEAKGCKRRVNLT